jgi:alcohol dehydrogenase
MSNSPAFALHAPTAVEFGAGVAANLGARAAALGVRHALLVTDPGLAGAQACHDARRSLEAAGVAATLYPDVVPDPTAASVAHGAAAFRASGADGLVALGGGSAMDSAKALGVLAMAGGEQIAPFFLGGAPIPGMPPLICLPTTAGTGSEVTWVAVVTHELEKRVLRDPKLAPALALVDPLLTLSMPPALTVSTGLDALAHALESLSSGFPNPYSDALALDAAARVARWLPRAAAHGDDLAARTELALAATLAGLAFLNARLHLGHAVGHSLGTHFKLSHGLACALCLPAILEFLAPARAEPLARAAAAMGGDTAAGATAALMRELGVPGVAAATGTRDLARLVAIVMAEERLIANSPRRPSRADWEQMIGASL